MTITRSALRWAAVGAAGLFAVSTLSACSTDGGGEASGDKGLIGVVLIIQADEQGQRVLKAVEKRAGELGYGTTVVDAQYDPTKASAAIDTFINQDVAGIVTFATDNELLAPKLAAAGEADIPVVAITGGPVVPGILWSMDNPEEEYAEALATELFTAVQEGDRAQTVVEMILPDAVPCRRREVGFDQAAAKFPDIKVEKYKIDGNNAVASANNHFQQYLGANPDIGGIVACWDIPMVGALTAAETVGVGPFPAAGINGSSQLVQEMQAGNPYIIGEVGVALAQAGIDAVDAIDKTLKGEDAGVPEGGYSTVTWGIFTPDNMPADGGVELDEWLPKGWDPDYWK